MQDLWDIEIENKEVIIMAENKDKVFSNTVINCLSMIYLTPLTNPYKIGFKIYDEDDTHIYLKIEFSK